MKRIVFLSLITFLGFSLQAQHFGLQAGVLASNIKWRNEFYTINSIVKPGFMAGITLDIPLKNTMAINLALNYKWTGASFIDSTNLSSVRFGYINFDATYDYIFDMGSYQLYAEGGGYIAYLVSAKKGLKPENEDVSFENLNIGTSETDDIKPWDMGLTVGVGVYLGKWKFGIGYQGSVINLSPGTEWILRNKVGYLRAAFFFNRKKNQDSTH